MTSSSPTVRRVAVSALVALVVGVGAATLLLGFSGSLVVQLLQGLAVLGAGAIVIGGAVAFALVRLANWRDPESEVEFEQLVERSERLAAEESWGDVEDYESEFDDDEQELFDPAAEEEDFKALVRAAVDDLPLEFHRALEHVAIVVSDGGSSRRAYGLYEGGTVTRDHFHDRILVFRDTLVRDFGHDPELLRAQVTRTVRHELAHHLGWDENGVRGLGL